MSDQSSIKSWSQWYESLPSEDCLDTMDQTHESKFSSLVNEALQKVDLQQVDMDLENDPLWKSYFKMYFNTRIDNLQSLNDKEEATNEDVKKRISLDDFLSQVDTKTLPNCEEFQAMKESLLNRLNQDIRNKLSFYARCTRPENVPEWVVDMYISFHGSGESAEEKRELDLANDEYYQECQG